MRGWGMRAARPCVLQPRVPVESRANRGSRGLVSNTGNDDEKRHNSFESSCGTRRQLDAWRHLAGTWAATGRHLGDNWAATGRQLGGNWAATVRDLGGNWAAQLDGTWSNWAATGRRLAGNWTGPGRQLGGNWGGNWAATARRLGGSLARFWPRATSPRNGRPHLPLQIEMRKSRRAPTAVLYVARAEPSRAEPRHGRVLVPRRLPRPRRGSRDGVFFGLATAPARHGRSKRAPEAEPGQPS